MKIYAEIVVMVMMNVLCAMGVQNMIEEGVLGGSTMNGIVMAVVLTATAIKNVSHILDIVRWVKNYRDAKKLEKEFLDTWEAYDKKHPNRVLAK